MDEVFADLGGIDILINNAGVNYDYLSQELKTKNGKR